MPARQGPPGRKHDKARHDVDKRQHFRIADFGIHLVCCGLDAAAECLLPSFAAFTHQESMGEPLFTLTVNDKQEPARRRTLVRRFDTGNGDTSVYTTPHGGYEYIIRDTKGRDCCLMAANSDFTECSCALNGTTSMRSFGLNNAMMMAFAFAASRKDALLIHASCVLHDGRAYPFIAKSGTGKSTHTSLWMRHIPDTELLNDDNPVIRIIDGKPFAYGSPWSGKTPCYRDTKATLGAVTRIERAETNTIERLWGAQAFAALLPACSSMKWDKDIYGNTCDTVARVIETTPIFTLHCLPDAEAALLCHKTITT